MRPVPRAPPVWRCLVSDWDGESLLRPPAAMIVVDGGLLRLQRGMFAFVTVEGYLLFGLKRETCKLVVRVQDYFWKPYDWLRPHDMIRQQFAIETRTPQRDFRPPCRREKCFRGGVATPWPEVQSYCHKREILF